MEAEREKFSRSLSEGAEGFQKNFQLSDPMVLAAGALMVGYAIGSGRWSWLNRTAIKLAEGLGVLALEQISQSFKSHNPQLFGPSNRVTH